MDTARKRLKTAQGVSSNYLAALGAADSCLNQASALRGMVMSFLTSIRDIGNASLIHQEWYAASCEPSHWEACVEHHFVAVSSSDVCEALQAPAGGGGMPFDIQTPFVLRAVLEATSDRGELQTATLFRALLHEEDFFKVVGPAFGNKLHRFVVQFPVLMLLLHSESFVQMKVDSCGREGYTDRRRFLLLIANVVRWHESCPTAGHIPWLVELHRWCCLYAPFPFDAVMVMPCATLLAQHYRCPLSEGTVAVLTSNVGHLLRRCFPLTQFSWDVVSQLPPKSNPWNVTQVMSTSAGGVSGRDAFGALVQIMEQFMDIPIVRLEVERAIEPFGTPVLEELVQAKVRRDAFLLLRHVVREERANFKELGPQ